MPEQSPGCGRYGAGGGPSLAAIFGCGVEALAESTVVVIQRAKDSEEERAVLCRAQRIGAAMAGRGGVAGDAWIGLGMLW